MDPKTKHAVTHSLEAHVQHIKNQVDASMRDGTTRQLAVSIVSPNGHVWTRDPRTLKEQPSVMAWGKRFVVSQRTCDSRDEMCEVERVWDFVRANFRYVYDPVECDTFATAKMSLLAGGGDCDDATILFCALLQSIGFHCAARIISTKSDPNEWVHVYPLVAVPKDNPHSKKTRWYPLDMTMPESTGPGWEYNAIAKHVDYQMW